MSNDTKIEPQRTESKRYEPPRIVETARFETLALGCTQFSGGPSYCGGPFGDPGTTASTS